MIPEEETKRKIVQLNVGGTRYDVSRDTLERCEGSMLASLISDHWKEGNSDYSEPIFIDRNGLLFQYVLDYLRANEVYLPTTVSRTAVIKEFEFYGIAVDKKKVHEKYGVEYCLSINKKADALNAERCAIRVAAFVESEFCKSSNYELECWVEISGDDYKLLYPHQNLFRERLLDRRLQLVSMYSAVDNNVAGKSHVRVRGASA